MRKPTAPINRALLTSGIAHQPTEMEAVLSDSIIGDDSRPPHILRAEATEVAGSQARIQDQT